MYNRTWPQYLSRSQRLLKVPFSRADYTTTPERRFNLLHPGHCLQSKTSFLSCRKRPVVSTEEHTRKKNYQDDEDEVIGSDCIAIHLSALLNLDTPATKLIQQQAIPEHMRPSPVKPGLQMQLKFPTVLMQDAFLLQL